MNGDDLLQRHDAPPGGVPEQLPYIPPSPLRCPIDYAGPTVEPNSATAKLGQHVTICVGGFDSDPLVSVEVAYPDGRTSQRAMKNRVPWYFPVDPTDPTGTYGLTAVQGTTTAQSGFTVGLPNAPLIGTLDPEKGPPGTSFRFAIVSSSPGQTVPVDLYRSEGNRFHYATTVASVTTDGQARASYTLVTGSNGAAGTYCLVGRPYASGCAEFVVT